MILNNAITFLILYVNLEVGSCYLRSFQQTTHAALRIGTPRHQTMIDINLCSVQDKSFSKTDNYFRDMPTILMRKRGRIAIASFEEDRHCLCETDDEDDEPTRWFDQRVTDKNVYWTNDWNNWTDQSSLPRDFSDTYALHAALVMSTEGRCTTMQVVLVSK